MHEESPRDGVDFDAYEQHLREKLQKSSASIEAAKAVLDGFRGLPEHIANWRKESIRNGHAGLIEESQVLLRLHQGHLFAMEALEIAEARHAVLLEELAWNKPTGAVPTA